MARPDVRSPRPFPGVVVMLAWALLLPPSAGHAQTIASAVLSGVVLDELRAPVGDVELTVTDQEGGGSRLQVTARDGVFRFGLLPPGSYTVTVERLGYRPQRIEAVPLRPGERLELNVALEAAPPPVEAPEVVRFEGSAAASRTGSSQWLSSIRPDLLPWERRDLGEIAALSSAATDALQVEGLPPSASLVMIDGVPYHPVRHPDLDRTGNALISLPLGALDWVELVTADPDLEWSNFAGGVLSAHTRRGASEPSGRGFGSWSGGPLRSSQLIDGSVPGSNSLWGGVLLGGAVVPDTVHFWAGAEVRRLQNPRPSPWVPGGAVDAEVIAAGRDAHSVALEEYTRPYVLETTLASGFGRFDWQLGNASALSVRAGFGSVLSVDGATELARSALPGHAAEGGDLLLTAALSSTVRGDWTHEIRVGVTRGSREYGLGAGGDASGPELPSTRVVAGRLSFGADPRLSASFERTGFTTAQSLEMSRAAHRLKFGFETEFEAHDDSYVYGRDGEFVFGGPEEFASGDGLLVQTRISSPRASYSRIRVGAFAQDAWSPAPGLQVLAGVRYDVETLPSDKVRLSQRWLDYTGIMNSDLPERVGTMSPRLGVTWDVGGQGEWIVRANAGAYGQSITPEVLSELLTLDATPSVLRSIGALAAWPALPGGDLSTGGSLLTVLGPDFRGPLTGRVSLGVTHHVASGTTLHVSATYRETEFLPRRADLNLQTNAAATDQHGRPLYGPLVQRGQLVTTSRPNRRFADFDLVSAINADGWSRYWGLTGGVEHDVGERLGLFARYTYSRTTDNWLASAGGGPDAELSPFPERGADDWREGVSDLDLTHRVAAGLSLRFGGAMEPRLTALYHYRSGYPFTPGFRGGVDVNGDGSGSNDPAFVDQAVAGVGEAAREWDCLRTQFGRFVERNSCRQPGVHTLNARFSLRLLRSPTFGAELVAEALNLTDPTVGGLDSALYLIDAGRLIDNSTGGTVTLPLRVNPDFGQSVGRAGTGRTLRVGVQVTF